MDRPRELDALRDLSAGVGADPLLVQGPGGNTSLKADGIMWIKASGTWLAQARDRDIFVPVLREESLEALRRNDPACETSQAFVIDALNAAGLRPSIETTVHAIMPQRVVVHVHCVETIAWAVRADAQAALNVPLMEFGWRFIPYRRPGLPLAGAIRERIDEQTEVLILGNHGLVVAADTVSGARRLLLRVVAALRRPTRSIHAPDIRALEEICDGTQYGPATDPTAHATALDPVSLAHASKGTLYPDHCVFLGPGVAVLEPGQTVGGIPPGAGARPTSKLILVPGAGILLPRDSPPAVLPMARCLADITARIGPSEPILTLTCADEDALLDWDAENTVRR